MRVLNVLENVPHGEGHRRIALKTAEACEKTPVLLVGPFTPPPRVAPVLEMLVKRHWVGLLLTEEDRSGIGQLAPAAQPHMGGGGGGAPTEGGTAASRPHVGDTARPRRDWDVLGVRGGLHLGNVGAADGGPRPRTSGRHAGRPGQAGRLAKTR